MADANYDWTSLVITLVGSAASIYAQISSKRRWIGVTVPFLMALAFEVLYFMLAEDKQFELGVVLVLGTLFLVIGSAGAAQWRRTSNRTRT